MSDCHPSTPQPVPAKIAEKTALIALAGQPNMGKSTLFNLLTGLNQHVGNWPGKTVERRDGYFQLGKRQIRLVDLPGTYSLTANSPEEVIAREFIIKDKPDLTIVIISAANLERSLYLVAELISLPTPLVIGLNMVDVANQEGIEVDAKILEAALGVPVIPMTAVRAIGVQSLLEMVEKQIDGQVQTTPRMPEIRADHRHVQEEIESLIDGFVPADYPLDWTALKLMEGDKEIIRLMDAALPTERWETVQEILKEHDDAILAIASGRYEWIERLTRASVSRPKLGQIGLTDRLDRWATHPFWGLIFLAGVLGLVFWLTFTIGSPLQAWLDEVVVAGLAHLASTWLVSAPIWLRGFIIDGLIGGAGSVLTFLPILAIFFASFGLLEDVGYMARAAYVMDNFMHWMGLHGKSFLPLFLGFGCNVPAVMGTRVIESWPARLLTILIAPLVPCTARMAVIAFITPAFFGPKAALVSWGLIMLSLVVLVVGGALLNRLLFKGERSAFVMELPLYHLPNPRTIGLLVWERSVSFIRKAGTTILAMSTVVWALSVLPGGNIQTSFLAQFGKWIEPVGKLMGMDWRLTVSLLTSFVAKENSIATLGVLFGGSQNIGLAHTLASIYTPATALAFLTVSMLFIPCAATVAAIKQETGSIRWTLFNIAFMLVISIGIASGVYALATAVGL